VPRVVITAGAAKGLEHRGKFLAEKNPAASRPAGQSIAKQFALPEANPEIGRPLDDLPELRELLVTFGDSGYVALYRYQPDSDSVYVLAFRHQKESGY